MTKLKQEIKAAIIKVPSHYDRIAEAAAEVAKRYIEKAFYESPLLLAQEPNPTQEGINEINRCKAKWLKENGITE